MALGTGPENSGLRRRNTWPTLLAVSSGSAEPRPWRLGSASLLAGSGSARAEASVVRLAKQFGISYLPLTVMEEEHLLEKQARQQGLELKTEWLRFTGGSGMNEALLSGNLDFAAGGVGPMLTIWGRTRGNLQVKGVAALNAMPLWLVDREPGGQVDQGLHRQGQDRPAHGEELDPGDHPADGRREGLRAGPAGQARPAHGLDGPSRRADGDARRPLRDHRAFRRRRRSRRWS